MEEHECVGCGITCLVEATGMLPMRRPSSENNDQKNIELFNAIQSSSYDTVRRLIIDGANVNAIREGDKQTPLHVAVISNNVNIVMLLFDHGARPTVNLQDHKGQTPLHWAVRAQKQNESLVKTLLDNGATWSVNIRDHEDQTPLYGAVITSNAVYVGLLLKHNATVNIIDAYNRTPLHWAAAHQTWHASSLGWQNCQAGCHIARLLLKNGAQRFMNVVDIDMETPFHIATRKGCEDLMKLFLHIQYCHNIDNIPDIEGYQYIIRRYNAFKDKDRTRTTTEAERRPSLFVYTFGRIPIGGSTGPSQIRRRIIQYTGDSQCCEESYNEF